jgi:hypothetical protein
VVVVVVVGSTQLCGHPNFVLGWSWVVTIVTTTHLPTDPTTPGNS